MNSLKVCQAELDAHTWVTDNNYTLNKKFIEVSHKGIKGAP